MASVQMRTHGVINIEPRHEPGNTNRFLARARTRRPSTRANRHWDSKRDLRTARQMQVSGPSLDGPQQNWTFQYRGSKKCFEPHRVEQSWFNGTG